jgi:hypothetical protein
MPKLVSHVIGLIEIDAPATPSSICAPSTADTQPLQERILRFDPGQRISPPRILSFTRAKEERRRCNLSRLCQELEAELIRVRRLMSTIQRMSRE